jgi:YbbR domain-containing protein
MIFKKIYSFLFKDIHWKLLSVALAFILWMAGMTVNNPTSTVQFHRALMLTNADVLARDGIVILNERELRAEQIRIGVRAPQSELALLDSRTDNIEVSVDLRQVDPAIILESDTRVTFPLVISTDILEGYERIYTRPRVVDVILDRHIRQPHNVNVYHEGTIRDGYELISLDCVNHTVTVSGARFYVHQVHEVRCLANLEGADQSLDLTVRLAAVDGNGYEVTQVDLSVRETDIRATILPYKTVELDINWTGMLAIAHTVKGDILIEPQTVEIVGPQEVLDEIDVLVLPNIELSFANSTQVVTRDIRQALDTRIMLRAGQPEEASAVITIEAMRRRDFLFDPDDIHIMGFSVVGGVHLLTNEPIRINVSGAESDMEALTRQQINIQLNLTGLPMGEHEVPLTLSLPPGISLVGEPPRVPVLLTAPVSSANNGSEDNGDEDNATDEPGDGENIEDEIIDDETENEE